MRPTPQFSAELNFHFREHGQGRRHWFMFGEDLRRALPMKMEGVDGLNTVSMWVREAGTFRAGESVLVECIVLAPEIFQSVVRPGVKFELWDAGFFAEGVVVERCERGWIKAAAQ
jgi:hypothetical protein